jgi:WD40 repeat protein
VYYCILYDVGVYSYKYCALTIATMCLYNSYILSDYTLQQGHSARVFHVHWSPLLHGVLASGSDDQSVRVWDVCGTLGSLSGVSTEHRTQHQPTVSSTSNSGSNGSSKRGSVGGSSSSSADSDNSSASRGMCCAVLEGHRHNVSTFLQLTFAYIECFQ